jgi:hypothetical protein
VNSAGSLCCGWLAAGAAVGQLSKPLIPRRTAALANTFDRVDRSMVHLANFAKGVDTRSRNENNAIAPHLNRE